MPLTHKHWYVLVQWNQEDILCIKSELRRFYLHFMHPATNELLNLLRRARPKYTNDKLRETIQQISDACENCRDYKPPPIRFRESVPPEKIVFNHEIAMDLMWLEKVPVLHVVDTHTNF